ncbi:hypothetical protein EI94DRAFT_1710552 [Lactarius quietus]|nr:hypothetical protein EI94DRAFT_1710552 [Lactarius quietus]
MCKFRVAYTLHQQKCLWSTGLNGFMPVRNLNERWGIRWWQGNRGQGTEYCNHAQVVGLIEQPGEIKQIKQQECCTSSMDHGELLNPYGQFIVAILCSSIYAF